MSKNLKHLHVKTKYGHVLTPHEIKAYKTMKRIVKQGAEYARCGTRNKYCQFASDWFHYFHESDARLLTNVIDDKCGNDKDIKLGTILALNTLGEI